MFLRKKYIALGILSSLIALSSCSKAQNQPLMPDDKSQDQAYQIFKTYIGTWQNRSNNDTIEISSLFPNAALVVWNSINGIPELPAIPGSQTAFLASFDQDGNLKLSVQNDVDARYSKFDGFVRIIGGTEESIYITDSSYKAIGLYGSAFFYKIKK